MVKSKTEMLQYEDRLRWERDQRALKQTGENKGYERGKEEGEKIGIEKGREEGDKKARIETAKKMKGKNLDVDFIADITGLSRDEIEKL